MRIAFITNEFVIEKPDGGGLGNYLFRVTKLLKHKGHDVEIFVTRHNVSTPRIINFNGIRVEHIPLAKNWYIRLVGFLDKLFIKTPYSGLAYNISVPISLSRALEKQHNEIPFDIVQSANVSCAGLFIKKRKDRKHILRLSSIVKTCLLYDGKYKGIGARLLVYLQHIILLRADKVYAPSIFTSNNYKLFFTPKIHLIRPPFVFDISSSDNTQLVLPTKYLIHFGSIGFLKGSDIIAKALVKIWHQIPDFKMVWVGKERVVGEMLHYQEIWGQFSQNVLWFPALKKGELYDVIKRSIAAVLPSRVDNLPNTVIESLFLKIPVIGSRGASIDELVIDGLNGALIEIGDVDQLAELFRKAWFNINLLLPDGFKDVPEIDAFFEDVAINNLLEFYKNA